jgi:23S rRNA pseudouridine2605 synthase
VRSKTRHIDRGNGTHGLARVLSKLGACSRSQAESAIREGRVTIEGRIVRDPERRSDPKRERIEIDGKPIRAAQRLYIAMNKPRGLIVTAADDQGRDTIYRLLAEANLPWIAPVGRLDRASEGLLFLSNDPEWAASITDPAFALTKTYHVQVDGIPDAHTLVRMVEGVDDDGELLRAVEVRMLRSGAKNAWLEIVLDEGRNRHLRRMLRCLGFEVLRLVRIAIGPVTLGDLPKGCWRPLRAEELQALASTAQ